MAAIASVGDDADKRRADLRLDLGQDGRQRVTVIRVAGIALAWAMNRPPAERCRVVASVSLPSSLFQRGIADSLLFRSEVEPVA